MKETEQLKNLMESMATLEEGKSLDRVEYWVVDSAGFYVTQEPDDEELLNFSPNQKRMARQDSKGSADRALQAYTQLLKRNARARHKDGDRSAAEWVMTKLPLKILEITYKVLQ